MTRHSLVSRALQTGLRVVLLVSLCGAVDAPGSAVDRPDWQVVDPQVALKDGVFGRAIAAENGRFVVTAPGCPAEDSTGCVARLDASGKPLSGSFAGLEAGDRRPGDRFGESVAASAKTIAVGAPASQRVFLFDSNGTSFATLIDPGGGAQSEFGMAIALFSAPTADWLAIGAPGQRGADGRLVGAAYVYRIRDRQVQLVRTLGDPTPSGDDRFGMALAFTGQDADPLAGTGSPLLAVGAPTDNSDGRTAGQVVVYSLDDLAASGNPSAPAPLHVLSDPTPTRSDLFGAALLFSNQTLFVGAPRHQRRNTPQGEVHAFPLMALDQPITLAPPEDILNQGFGQPLGVAFGRLLVGAVTLELAPDRVSGRLYHWPLDQLTPGSGRALALAQDGHLDHFGTAVAFSGQSLLVGVPSFDGEQRRTGRVVLCRRCFESDGDAMADEMRAGDVDINQVPVR